jgi:hypothetical protein
MPLYITGVVTALVCQNSSHIQSVCLYKLANDPLSCTAVQEPSPSHWINTYYVSFFSQIPFWISSTAEQLLFFFFLMHRLAIYCIVSITTSQASSPGSVLQITLDCIGYVMSSGRICILETGKDMKGSSHRLLKHTSALACEDRRKPQIITGRTLCKWHLNGT